MVEAPNVFIFSADSLRADYYEEIFSALRDRIAGVTFTQAIATGSGTPHSIPSLAAGVYADYHDTMGIPQESPPRTLAEVFAEAGYRCSLWSDNSFFGEEYNYDRGFHDGLFATENRVKKISALLSDTPLYSIAKWVYFNVVNRTGGSPLYAPAAALHSQALNWLAGTGGGPTFCWLHYMDTHHPFEPPAAYLTDDVPNNIAQLSRDVIKSNAEGYGPAELDAVESAYRGSCEYLNDEVGKFLDTLLEEGYFDPDRDILVFTADHGEVLNPDFYGTMGHTPVSQWEELIRVPLFVAAPDWGSTTVEEQVSLIDLPGTVCALAGQEAPGQMVVDGCDRPTDLARDAAFIVHDPMWETTYRGIRTPEEKLFAYRDAEKEDQIVYENIATDERHIRPGQTFDGLGGARPLYDRLVTDCGPLTEDSGPGDLSDDVEEHLSDLGYVDV